MRLLVFGGIGKTVHGYDIANLSRYTGISLLIKKLFINLTRWLLKGYNGVGYILLVFGRYTSYSSSSKYKPISDLHHARADSTLHMMSLNPCTISQYSCDYYRYVSDIEIK